MADGLGTQHQIDLVAFVELVAEMRKQQKTYFLTRSASALADAKLRERDVDAAINRLRNGGEQQKGLFK